MALLASEILAAGMPGALLAQALAPVAVVAPVRAALPGRHKCRSALNVEKNDARNLPMATPARRHLRCALP